MIQKSLKINLLSTLFLVLSFLVLAQNEVLTRRQAPVIETNNGKIRGCVHAGIHTYKGIPYVTAKRFETAVKIAAWEGVKSTTMYGPVSPLIEPTTSMRDEPEFVAINYLFGRGGRIGSKICAIHHLETA